MATPRQRLSDQERSRRLDDAVQRFVGDVIGLGHPGDAVRGRIGYVNEEHTLSGWMRVDELTAMQRRLVFTS